MEKSWILSVRKSGNTAENITVYMLEIFQSVTFLKL